MHRDTWQRPLRSLSRESANNRQRGTQIRLSAQRGEIYVAGVEKQFSVSVDVYLSESISVTQSCTPGSSPAFSSDGGSPLRKLSTSGNGENGSYRTGHGTTTQLFAAHPNGYGSNGMKYHHYQQGICGGERQLSVLIDDLQVRPFSYRGGCPLCAKTRR